MSGLETTTALNAKVSEVESKLADASSLVTTTVANTKISEVDNKTPDYDKYITTQEFNKLFLQNFTARLKEVNLVSKTDFHNKLTSFHRKNTLNKKKYLEVQNNKLCSLTTKDYNFSYVEYFLQVIMHLEGHFFINQHLIC